ncbi:MAG: helix-turn-helix transcriptional regulator [Lachnospiraceae bacterium]
MNLTYLMKFISRTLHTAIHQFSLYFTDHTTICERKDLPKSLEHHFSSIFIEHHTFKNQLLLSAVVESPKVYSDSNGLSYCVCFSQNSIFIIGPVLLPLDTKSKYELPKTSFQSEWIEYLHACKLESFIDISLLLYNLFIEQPLTIDQVLAFNCLDSNVNDVIFKDLSLKIFSNRESSQKHNPYDQEVREFNSIRTGDVKQLERSWGEDYLGNIGTLSKTPLRHFKNLAIVLVTLASRAAMEGGVHPETAYSLSDSFILKIEDATSGEEARQLGRQAEYQYAVLVRDTLNQNSKRTDISDTDSRIIQCKDFIFAHLHDKITISSIATHLYMNSNYLADLFKKKEGITIGAFILNEKINLAKNLLIYSKYSYIEIASYLGFSSQSHLGKQFKQQTGYTLKEYRNIYGVKEFL